MGEPHLSNLKEDSGSQTSPAGPLVPQPTTLQLEPPSAIVDEKLFICSACGAELPERRRNAHETLWCTRIDRAIGSSSEEDLDRDGNEIEVTENGCNTSCGLRARGNMESACDTSDEDLQCKNASADDTSDIDPLLETPKTTRRRSNLSLFFLFLIVAPTCGAIFQFLLEYVNPLVLKVQPHDAETIKKVFFGGDSWVVYCVNKRIDGGVHTQMLQKAAQILRPEGIHVAEVHCWIPLPTRKGPRTLAQRFRFRDSPPVAMMVTKGTKPRLLNAQDLTVDGLVHQIRHPSNGSAPRRASRSSNSRKNGRRDSVGQRPQEEAEIDEITKPQPAVAEEVIEDEDAEVVNLDA